MAERIVSKNLAGLEDLLLGKGTVNQERAAQTYPISKIPFIYPCDNSAELATLDTDKFKYAAVRNGLKIEYYSFDGLNWVKTLFDSLQSSTKLSLAQNVAGNITLPIGNVKSFNLVALYRCNTNVLTEQLNTQGIALLGLSTLFYRETIVGTKTSTVSGNISLTISGTNIVFAKTAGTGVAAGELILLVSSSGGV